MNVRKILKKHTRLASDKQEKATHTVLEQQAELIAKDWIGVPSVKKILKLPVPSYHRYGIHKP